MYVLRKFNIDLLRSIGGVAVGSAICKALDFLFLLVAAQSLEPEEFGIFSIFKTIFLSSAVIIRVGLDNTFLKISADYQRKGLLTEEKFLVFSYFIARFFMVTIFILCLPLISNNLCAYMGLPETQRSLAMLVFVSVLGLCVFEFVQTRNRSSDKYALYVFLEFLRSGGRLALMLLIIYYFRNLTISSATYLWISFPFFAGVLGLLFQPWPSLHLISHANFINIKSQLVVIGSFAKWIALSACCTMLLRGMDILILTRYVTKNDIGLYSAAMNIGNMTFLIANTLNVVLIPHVCRMEITALIQYFRAVCVWGASILCIVCFISYLYDDRILMIFYGPKYTTGGHLFRLIIISSSIGSIISPFIAIAYRLNLQKLVFELDVSRALIAVVSFMILIPEFGTIGAVFSLLFCYSISSFFGIYLIYKRLLSNILTDKNAALLSK